MAYVSATRLNQHVACLQKSDARKWVPHVRAAEGVKLCMSLVLMLGESGCAEQRKILAWRVNRDGSP